MENVTFSLSVSENEQVKSSLEIELKSVGDGRHKPFIKMQDVDADFSVSTALPAGNYASLLGKIKQMSKDPKSFEKFSRTLLTIISVSQVGAK